MGEGGAIPPSPLLLVLVLEKSGTENKFCFIFVLSLPSRKFFMRYRYFFIILNHCITLTFFLVELSFCPALINLILKKGPGWTGVPNYNTFCRKPLNKYEKHSGNQGSGSSFILCESGSGSRSRSSLTKFEEEKNLKSFLKL